LPWVRRLCAAALVGLSGCGLLPVPPQGGASLELRQTPFFPQDVHQCGPAALATVLVAGGIETTPELLTPQIFVPGREGSLQVELLATARRYDRVPLRIGRELADLRAALADGQPVLVLQNLGLRHWPRWHYAVVIGFDAAADRFLLRSGTTFRESLLAQNFLASWDRADRWAFVVTTVDSIPEHANVEAWIAAAAPFESLGRLDLAEQAYESALRKWPDSALVWQGIANVRHARGRGTEAEQALRRALEIRPQEAAARNNLAYLLLERGCPSAARQELNRIQDLPKALSGVVADTRAEIEAATQRDREDCPN
jgi:tetratricopeptide (TPR) repeat protein